MWPTLNRMFKVHVSVVNTAGVTGRVTLFLTTGMSRSFAKLGLNSRSCGLFKIVCPEICFDFVIDCGLVKPIGRKSVFEILTKNLHYLIPIILNGRNCQYGLFLTYVFGHKTITAFTNLSSNKKGRVIKTIRVLQKLQNRCGLTYDSMYESMYVHYCTRRQSWRPLNCLLCIFLCCYEFLFSD